MVWRTLIFSVLIVAISASVIFVFNAQEEQTNSNNEEENSQVGGDIASEEADSQQGPVPLGSDVDSQIGSVAKDFTLETLAGDTLRLYDNDGKPTLINFWATWCPPCREEMPHLQSAYEQYGDEVNFFMIDLLFNDNLNQVTKYIEESKFTFPVLLDEHGDVMNDYEAIVIPTTYIVNEENTITHKIMGQVPEEKIQSLMEEITK